MYTKLYVGILFYRRFKWSQLSTLIGSKKGADDEIMIIDGPDNWRMDNQSSMYELINYAHTT